MGYTDSDLTGVKVKRSHLNELKSSIENLALEKKISVYISIPSVEKITASHVQAIQDAVNNLESKFSNNCCQANCCQTCQGCQKCQDCQGCQSCQTCQTEKECYNPNCDCGDDIGSRNCN